MIPGFASTVLKVEESFESTWVNERIWLSFKKISSSKFSASNSIDLPNLNVHGNDFENKWLRHMSLSSDCFSDPSQIKVRPAKGKEGVAYITPGLFTNSLTYIFGPLIDQLEELGYTEKNLGYAPYDWRIPFYYMEARDCYFSQLAKSIEEMVKVNQKPVVLLAHSMGNKVIHYFLQKMKVEKGQDWLDYHIHTLFSVGAPWLGAHKTLRALTLGERFGLDPFLTEEEAKQLTRTFGGFLALLPNAAKQSYFEKGNSPETYFYYREKHHPVSKPISIKDAINLFGCSVTNEFLDISYFFFQT